LAARERAGGKRSEQRFAVMRLTDGRIHLLLGGDIQKQTEE
jgi:hypothetical protein